MANTIHGGKGVAFGVKASFGFTSAAGYTANAWVGIPEQDATPDKGVDIIGYTLTDATEIDTVAGANGLTLAKGYSERKIELQCEVICWGDDEAKAKEIELPLPLAVLKIVDGDNPLINGTWNVKEGGSISGTTDGFRKASITLEKFGASNAASNALAGLASI